MPLTCQSKIIYSQCKLVYFTMSLCRPSLLDKLQQSNEEVKAYLTQKQGEFFFFTSNTQRAVSVKNVTTLFCANSPVQG